MLSEAANRYIAKGNKFADENISNILQRIDPSIVSTVYLRSRIVVSKKCVDLIKDALKQCNKFISFEDAEYWEQLGFTS